MPKKKKSQDEETSLGGAIIGGLFSVFLGTVLGFFSLASVRPQMVDSLPPPEEKEVGRVYFVRGSESGAANWRANLDAIADSQAGTYTFSEADLNVWVKSTFKLPETPEGALIKVIPAQPNFRIDGDRLQLASVVKISAFGQSSDFLVQTKGRFVQKSGLYTFKAEEMFVSSAPVPSLLGFPGLFLGGIVPSFTLSEEGNRLTSGWSRLSDLRIENDQITLVLQ